MSNVKVGDVGGVIEIEPEPEPEPGLYRHFKGAEYRVASVIDAVATVKPEWRVVAFAFDSETQKSYPLYYDRDDQPVAIVSCDHDGQRLVLYKGATIDARWWVREVKNFMGMVPRFKRV